MPNNANDSVVGLCREGNGKAQRAACNRRLWVDRFMIADAIPQSADVVGDMQIGSDQRQGEVSKSLRIPVRAIVRAGAGSAPRS